MNPVTSKDRRIPQSSLGRFSSPLLAFPWRAAQITDDPELKQVVANQLDFALRLAPRAADGTAYHNGETFWSDSFHTTPPFLACAGDFDEAIRQIEGQRKRLWNPRARLLTHDWDEREGQWQDKRFWGGGQGWASAALTRVIRALPADHPADKAKLTDNLQELINGCLAPQRPAVCSTMWWAIQTVSRKPTLPRCSPIRFTTACGTAGCLQVIWPPPTRCVPGARTKVDADGFVHGVCGASSFVKSGLSTEGQTFFLMMEAAARKLYHPTHSQKS